MRSQNWILFYFGTCFRVFYPTIGWSLEETLKSGERVSEDMYNLKLELEMVRNHPMEEGSLDISCGSESDGQAKLKKMKHLKKGMKMLRLKTRLMRVL